MRRFQIPRLTIAVAFALSVVAAPTSTAAADPSSDIPGVPLPGSVVSGPLGGSIFDVVYRLDVPATSVIIAGLTGTEGTDFDLYLFDATATTVVTNVGVVARSTGPTSEEALAYVARAGGTFYLDLNGATEVQGTYTLSVQIVPDPSPPTVRMVLEGGAPATNDPTVTVAITAADDLSGVTDMAFSADGITYRPWEAYSGTSTWSFSPGDGIKTVWVKVRNGVGGESAPVSASIRLDTEPPGIVAISPIPDAAVPALRPMIRVSFNEPLDPVSWSTLGLALQTAAGALVPGTLSYEPATNTGTFTPSADLIAGDLYFATLGQPRDIAGNAATTAASWWLRPTIATSLTLVASAKTLTFGSSAVLSGSASIPAGASPTLESRPTGANAFAPVAGELPTGGFFSTLVNPATTTTYRVTYPGSTTAAAAVSPSVTIGVRWWVVVSGRGPSITRTGSAGVPIVVQARTGPVTPGVGVSFKLYRYDASRRAYVYAGSRGTRTRADGTASISWTPSVGRWRWRVAVSAAPGISSATSAAYTWSISRR
jgi:hypothetical protein